MLQMFGPKTRSPELSWFVRLMVLLRDDGGRVDDGILDRRRGAHGGYCKNAGGTAALERLEALPALPCRPWHPPDPWHSGSPWDRCPNN